MSSIGSQTLTAVNSMSHNHLQVNQNFYGRRVTGHVQDDCYRYHITKYVPVVVWPNNR